MMFNMIVKRKMTLFVIILSFILLCLLAVPYGSVWANNEYKQTEDVETNIIQPCDQPYIETKLVTFEYSNENLNTLEADKKTYSVDYEIEPDTFIKNFSGYSFINCISDIDNNYYVYKYHKLTEKEIIANDGGNLGNYGRFYCPTVGISVAINYCSSTNNYSQQQNYVNMSDSACFSPYGCESFLCDHYHQGFYKITSISEGILCYIKRLDGTIETWKCVYGGNGINGVYDCLMFNGTSIGSQNAGGICLYTCHGDDSYNVYMRFLQRVD